MQCVFGKGCSWSRLRGPLFVSPPPCLFWESLWVNRWICNSPKPLQTVLTPRFLLEQQMASSAQWLDQRKCPFRSVSSCGQSTARETNGKLVPLLGFVFFFHWVLFSLFLLITSANVYLPGLPCSLDTMEVQMLSTESHSRDTGKELYDMHWCCCVSQCTCGHNITIMRGKQTQARGRPHSAAVPILLARTPSRGFAGQPPRNVA